ncbi:hypothetical protein N9W34_04860 [Rickettsiales bacterium]|nr:hypothetical protein [Rickettsiales bacterium]
MELHADNDNVATLEKDVINRAIISLKKAIIEKDGLFIEESLSNIINEVKRSGGNSEDVISLIEEGNILLNNEARLREWIENQFD